MQHNLFRLHLATLSSAFLSTSTHLTETTFARMMCLTKKNPSVETGSPTSPLIVPVYSVEQDIQDLAMEIYARLAFDHIKTNPDHFDHQLSDLAKRSHTAALAYFETLGATIDGGQPNGQ